MTRKRRLEARVRMDKHGRILIPAAIREAMNIEAGDVLFLQWRSGVLRMQTRLQRIAKAQALVRRYIPVDVSLVDELIAERREETRREEEKYAEDERRWNETMRRS